jgi:hypothetical protein
MPEENGGGSVPITDSPPLHRNAPGQTATHELECWQPFGISCW